jgi:hypothetical protein
LTLLNLKELDRNKLRTGKLVGLPSRLAKAIRSASDTPNRRDLILENQFELMVSYVEHEEDGVYVVRVSNVNSDGHRFVHTTLFDTFCKCVSFELLKHYAVYTSGTDFDVWYSAEDMESLSDRDNAMYLYVPSKADNVRNFVCIEK